MFHREGIWLVKKETDDFGVTNFKSILLEGFNEKNIKLYPFVNVEKYREDIEKAILKYFETDPSKPFVLNALTTTIIASITNRIILEKEKRPLCKEDFYE